MVYRRNRDFAYRSLREKSIGKAVPTRATATAPAIKYVVPSAETSPMAATIVEVLFWLRLLCRRDNADGLIG